MASEYIGYVASNTALDVPAENSVQYVNSFTGTVIGGKLYRNMTSLNVWYGFPEFIITMSRCISTMPATGTIEKSGSEATLVCNGNGDPQLFVINGDVGMDSLTNSFGLNTRNCPVDRTLIITVQGGPIRYVGSYSWGSVWDHNPTKILWNVVQASEVRVYGTGQSIGTYLLPVYNNFARFRTPGINGRVYSRGHVEHGPYGGSEVHNYPFDGVLPNCGRICSCWSPK